MNINSFMNNGLDFLYKIGGVDTTCKIISYTFWSSGTSGTYYDDEPISQTLTGSSVISGLIFPIQSKQGSSEALLLEQGKLETTDKTLYCGSLSTSGNLIFVIGSDSYTVIPDGIERWDVAGSTILNKVFLRLTITGSLY